MPPRSRPATWGAHHSFGLGGLFGDTVLGTLLGLLPVAPGLGLRLSALGLGALVLGAGAFVLGFDRAELRRIGRFLILGVILTYAGLRALVARGLGGLAGAGQAVKARRAAREAQEARTATAPQAGPVPGAARVRRAEPSLGTAGPARKRTATGEKPGGLLARMPALMRKPEAMPEPELVETAAEEGVAEAPPEDRIRARISDVIRAKVRQNPAVQVESVAPLTKGRGRGPDPLILNGDPRGTLPPEPPLTSARLSVPPAPEDDALIEPDMPGTEATPDMTERPRIPSPSRARWCSTPRKNRRPPRRARRPRRSPRCPSAPRRRTTSCRRCRCCRTRRTCSATTSATRRWRKTRGCWKTCSTITASRARS